MTWRNHFRAFLRWWTPWEEDTRLWALSALTVLGFFTLICTVIARDLDFASVMLAAICWIVAAFLIWRAVEIVLFLLIATFTKNGFKALVYSWKEMGKEPLFKTIRREVAYSQDWRQSAKWLQSRGMSRRDAKESAKTSSRARVVSEILKERNGYA